jgi:hypothetical protein
MAELVFSTAFILSEIIVVSVFSSTGKLGIDISELDEAYWASGSTNPIPTVAL